jgi:hypothetical protein
VRAVWLPADRDRWRAAYLDGDDLDEPPSSCSTAQNCAKREFGRHLAVTELEFVAVDNAVSFRKTAIAQARAAALSPLGASPRSAAAALAF